MRSWVRVRGVGAGECNRVEWQQRRHCAETGQDRVTRTGSEVCSRAARVRGPTPSNMHQRSKAGNSVASPATPQASQAPSTRYATNLPVNVISLFHGEAGRLASAASQLSLHGRHVVEGQRGSLLEACDMQGSTATHEWKQEQNTVSKFWRGIDNVTPRYATTH